MFKLLAHISLYLFAAPLLLSVTVRVKAMFSGRKGAPLLQPYRDILRCISKGATFSPTTTAFFRVGPAVALTAMIAGSLLIPVIPGYAPLTFNGDFLLLAYLFGVARFFTVLAALDTGSSFEGMGAGRELMISALAEPALFLCMVVILRTSGGFGIAAALGSGMQSAWSSQALPLWLSAASVFFLLLAENCRIPVDDPTTHLELTMIHEVMVLDHSGPDFAFIQLGAAIKYMIFSSLLACMLVPAFPEVGNIWGGTLLRFLAMAFVAASVGVVESVMARLRMDRVRLFLTTAVIFPAVGLVMTFV